MKIVKNWRIIEKSFRAEGGNFVHIVWKFWISRRMNEKIERNFSTSWGNFREIFLGMYLYIQNVIWETIHKVGKRDFEIFKASHRGETEENSEKKNRLKSSILHPGMTLRYDVLKVEVAKSYVVSRTKSWEFFFRDFHDIAQRRDRGVFWKKYCLKSSILHRGMRFWRSMLQKASFENKAFIIFLSQCVENNLFRLS